MGEMPELEEVASKPMSAFSTPMTARRDSNQEAGARTTPIPIIRSDSPTTSLRSGHSYTGQVRQPGQQAGFGGSEFNMMMSETRLQNTEMRMNIQRLSDKMESLINVQNMNPIKQNISNINNDELMGKLDLILEQNKEMKNILGKQNVAHISTSASQEYFIKQQKLQEQSEMLQRLENALREKEQQLAEELLNRDEVIRQLEKKLEEQTLITESTQQAARSMLQSEVRKLLGSTGKLLLNQFSEDEVYSGDSVRATIGHTFSLISDKLQEKYGSDNVRDPPPVAAVAPVPAEVEEWEAESED